MIFIYTTCASEAEAKSLGEMIIKQKMGAAVEYWPVNSIACEENGQCKELAETMLMITTLEPKLEEVNDFMSQHHSYSVPLVAGLDIHRINRAYKEWMAESMT